MWWLRELRYTVAGKIIILALCGAVVAGVGVFAYRAFGDAFTQGFSDDEVDVAGGTTVVTIPLTATQAQCKDAIAELDKIVKETTKFANIDTAQSNSAFAAYAKAVKSCTFNEFYEFEQSTLLPWMSGQDMYNAAVESGDLEVDGEATTETTEPTETTETTVATETTETVSQGGGR